MGASRVNAPTRSIQLGRGATSSERFCDILRIASVVCSIRRSAASNARQAISLGHAPPARRSASARARGISRVVRAAIDRAAICDLPDRRLPKQKLVFSRYGEQSFQNARRRRSARSVHILPPAAGDRGHEFSILEALPRSLCVYVLRPDFYRRRSGMRK